MRTDPSWISKQILSDVSLKSVPTTSFLCHCYCDAAKAAFHHVLRLPFTTKFVQHSGGQIYFSSKGSDLSRKINLSLLFLLCERRCECGSYTDSISFSVFPLPFFHTIRPFA